MEKINEYFETRLNRVILDYFLQRKFFDLAKVFSKETGIEPFSDIDIHLEINDILVRFNLILDDREEVFIGQEYIENQLKDIK